MQSPVRLSRRTEPEPDLVVLRPRDDFYAAQHAGPADILLAVEVAESSLDYDRLVKSRVYAEAGVPEYWLVNILEGMVTRFREPRDGAYREVREYRPGESLTPDTLPDCAIAVDGLLP